MASTVRDTLPWSNHRLTPVSDRVCPGERSVQQRIRRMSSAEGAKYDVHGRAFQNMELLPFVDSMWTCEGIDFRRG